MTATRERDADAFCDELVTQEFLEQATGATGDAGREACKREFNSLTGVEVELVRDRADRGGRGQAHGDRGARRGRASARADGFA